MNSDQQQQLQPPPPALLTADRYAGYNASNTHTTIVTTTEHDAAATTTYVNIGMISSPATTATAPPPLPLPLPPSSLLTSTISNCATTPLGTTSTFKTPLLPMPSLEDIEVGMVGVGVGVGMLPSNAQQPIPGGILKYPTTTTTIQMNLPIGMGPGPALHHHQQQQQQQHHGLTLSLPPPPLPSSSSSSAVTYISNDATSCGTLKSNSKLLHSSSSLSSPLQVGGCVSGGGIGGGNTSTNSNNCNATTMIMGSVNTNTSASIHNNTNTATSTNLNIIGSGGVGVVGGGVGVGVGSNSGSGSASGNNGNNNLRHKTSSKCCACFGSGRAESSSSSSAMKAKKKRKQKSQTLWSALLTNLGICTLLLAYTLLGSFIFLTIESEDSTLLHQQRTLASTKRVGLMGVGGGAVAGGAATAAAAGVTHNNINDGGSNENIYHTSSSQMQRLDNGTLMAAVASSSTSSQQQQQQQQSLLEGIVPLNGIGNNNNNNNNNDFIYGDDTSPHLALSADTYDVRQRTIENIWDITVSLNILYKENWTKLAALEIAKFQDQLMKRLNEDALLQLSHDIDGTVTGGGNGNSPATEAVLLHTHQHGHHHGGAHEWNFAKAFLYSLTVLTTIGYGNIAPRTTLGRLVTLVYALFGIPLTLVYLSSTGGILAKVAREVFSKALCCCLCSNCGYCCYDEKRMAEKERRMKRKRQQEELRKQQAAMQEPYYVRSGSMHDSFQATNEKQSTMSQSVSGMSTTMTVGGAGGGVGQLPPDIDSLSASESHGSMHGLSILAPILLCLSMMIIYIMFGAVVLYRLENWPLLDGIYFCFMSLSTIGFGDMLPGLRRESTTTTWFCSMYIMSGMALTAMCFNVIHEEIVHRIKIVVEFKKGSSTLDTTNDEHQGYYMPP